jgi:hypothetical protein
MHHIVIKYIVHSYLIEPNQHKIEVFPLNQLLVLINLKNSLLIQKKYCWAYLFSYKQFKREIPNHQIRMISHLMHCLFH